MPTSSPDPLPIILDVSAVRLASSESVLLVVDIQTKLLPYIDDGARVLRRATFLAQVARELEIPVIATEQSPEKMGATAPELGPVDPPAFAKMSFGIEGCSDALAHLRRLGRRQVVIVGMETHICVSLTAHALMAEGYAVVVCPDGVGARTLDRHKLGMERIRDAGAVPAHTEAVAYEWMGSADHPRFRAILALVKEAGA